MYSLVIDTIANIYSSFDPVSFISETIKRLGYFFYICDPRKHNYEKIEDVPDYYKDVAPIFMVTILLEQVVRYLQKKPTFRINETMSNVLHGYLMDLSKIPFKGFEVFVYAWVYNNYRIIELPWNSPWTWLLAWITTDFCFYWMHRITHQVNILWAIHEPHHTPEEMQFSSPMRNSILLLPIHWLTYVPLALAVPPTTFLVHYQITIIYQYWLHTEIIGKLPAPIEFMLSTPSHHRAHHGRNRRYIDKNFGGFLIIWDRMFGTFEEEDPEEKPLYGCTTQTKSFNPLIIQTQHFIRIWKRFCEYEKWGDKLSAIFKGPGWTPGSPWTGNIEDVQHPAPHFELYDPKISNFMKLYTQAHFYILLNTYQLLAWNMTVLPKTTINPIACFICYTCISLGFMLDNSRYGPPFEVLRCIIYFLVDRIIYSEIKKYGLALISLYINRVLFSVTLAMWASLYLVENLRKIYKEKNL